MTKKPVNHMHSPKGSGKSGIAKPKLRGMDTTGPKKVHGGLLTSGPTTHPAFVGNHGAGHDGRKKRK